MGYQGGVWPPVPTPKISKSPVPTIKIKKYPVPIAKMSKYPVPIEYLVSSVLITIIYPYYQLQQPCIGVKLLCNYQHISLICFDLTLIK